MFNKFYLACNLFEFTNSQIRRSVNNIDTRTSNLILFDDIYTEYAVPYVVKVATVVVDIKLFAEGSSFDPIKYAV